jgi:hypothetical protein
MSTTEPILCPKCGRADAVRKVSAIVAKGTRTGETGGIALGLGDRSFDLMPFVGTSISRSALAARLAPPARPAKPLGYGWMAAFMVGRLALVLCVGLLLIGTILLSFPLLINTYSQNRMLLLIPIIILITFVVSAVCWVARAGTSDVHLINGERNSYDVRLRAWESAMEQWNELYYCSRDDGVFQANPPKLLPKLLYRTRLTFTEKRPKLHKKSDQN